MTLNSISVYALAHFDTRRLRVKPTTIGRSPPDFLLLSVRRKIRELRPLDTDLPASD